MAITLDGTNGVGIGSSSTENGLNIKQPYATLTLERTNSPTGRFDLKPYNDTLSIRNSSQTDIVKIDNAGRVTMPYQPSFKAHGFLGTVEDGLYTLGTNVDENVGGHYNTSTGRFTAPVAGTYYFVMHFSSTDSQSHYGQLAKNGVRSDPLILDYGKTYSNLTASMVMYLNAGDYVTALTRFNTGHYSSFFSGFLVG